MSGIPDARVFFTTSGTEANDTALLLASNYRRSNQILAMRNSYHGRSFSAMAITGHRSWSSSSYSGLNVNFVHGGYRLRSPFRDFDDDGYTQACVDDLVQVIDMMTAGDVACMIAEPIQGVGGFATPPDGFFGAMKKELDNHEILFISDEVQTGWGRTGEHFWGYRGPRDRARHPHVRQGCRQRHHPGRCCGESRRDGLHQRRVVLDVRRQPAVDGRRAGHAGPCAQAQSAGQRAPDGKPAPSRSRQLVVETPWIAEARGKGLMQALETVQPGGIEPDAAKAGALMEAAKSQGLLIGKGGLYGNVVRIAPMLNVSAAEVDEGLDALRAAVATIRE